MGCDLTNSTGASHPWKTLAWWSLLNLARYFRWKPSGTLPPNDHPDPAPWDGNYFHNAGQHVTADDAAALANALETLFHSPTREQTAQAVARRMDQVLQDQRITSQIPSTTSTPYPLDFIRQMLARFNQKSVDPWQFDHSTDRHLSDFISFCRTGRFTID
jgi:hypothetical protein